MASHGGAHELYASFKLALQTEKPKKCLFVSGIQIQVQRCTVTVEVIVL